MFIPVRQYNRDIQIYDLSGENKDINITYINNLMGFTVLYKGISDTNWKKINAYPEGTTVSEGVTYSLTEINEVKMISIKFNKIPSNNFNPTNGSLKIIVFTTLGSKGNFVIPNLDNDESLSGLIMTIAQDTSDKYQEALIPIIPTGSLYDLKAENGRDAMTIDEVRKVVINRTMSTIITPMALYQEASEMGYSHRKVRHDLLDWQYKLSKSLKDENGNVIPSRTIDVNFLFNQRRV
jgi:hypothetical protein